MEKAIIFAPCDLDKIEYSTLCHMEQEPILCWSVRHLVNLEKASDVYYVTSKNAYSSTQYQEVVLKSWEETEGKKRWLLLIEEVDFSKAKIGSVGMMLKELPIRQLGFSFHFLLSNNIDYCEMRLKNFF